MWIMILGPTGSGKNFVADQLKKDGYQRLDPPTFGTESENVFENQLNYLMGRFRIHMKASQERDRKDVLTVRSFHDTHLVLSEVLRRTTELSDKDKKVLDTIYKNLANDDFYITPPDVVIYMRAKKMTAITRQLLRGVDVSDEFFNHEVELYEEFMPRIGSQIIELDVSLGVDDIFRNVEFGINSIKAANLGSQSIWQREFLRT